MASNALVSLSSSFQTSPNFWLSQNGVAYNIAVQTPQYKLDSLDALRNIPINSSTAPAPQLLDNLTSMTQTAEPAVVSHYNVQPVIDVYANVQGRDLGGVATDIARITTAAAKQLPQGSTFVTRGQVSTMRSSFIGLIGGLAFAIASGLSAHRREFPVVDRGVYRDHGASRGSGRNRVGAVSDANHFERSRADGNHHEHGRRHREQCPGHHLRE